MKKKTAAVKPLASSPEYMRRYRLKNNPDPRSRVAIKAKHYLTDAQAREVERMIDKMIGWS